MKIKKTLAWLLALTMLLALPGCGDRGDAPDSTLTGKQNIDKTPVEVGEIPDYAALAHEKLDAVTDAPESDFVYTVANGVAVITEYTGSAASVRVPQTLGGATVTGIGDGAFSEHGEIKALLLPDTLLHIGTGILKKCNGLTYLECTLMGKDADSAQFLGYLFGADTHENNPRDIPPSLSLVRLGESVGEVKDYAFFDCNDLSAVILPNGILSVGKFSFFNCTSLESVLGLDKLASVGAYAFADCTAFEELRFGADLSSMGYAALLGCDGLVSVTLPFVGGTRAENTYLGYIFGAESVDFSKGYYPPRLSRVELLEGCEALGNYAFFECETLKEVVLPEGLTEIGARAFYECTALWSIQFPDSLGTIREAAFFGCESLVEIDFGEGLSKIGANAFYACVSLPSVTLPASLKSLPASCFADCVSLKTVRLGGVTKVGAQAFRNCRALKSVSGKSGISFEQGNELAENKLK